MKKRIISLGLSLAMVLTSANSIFAATTTITGNPAGNSLPYASAAATGDGSLTYLDKDVTIVTLPTDDLNFSMDPQGIIGATKAVDADTSLNTAEAKQSAFTNALSTYAGRIYGNNILTIKNEGANEVEVGVSVVAKVTRDGGEAQKTKLKTNGTNTARLGDTDVTPDAGDDKKANIISLDVAYTGYKEDTPGDANEENAGPVEFAAKADNKAKGKRVLGFDPFEGSSATIAGYAGFDKTGSQIKFQFDEDITYGIKYGAADSNGNPTATVANGVANTDQSKANKTKGVTVGFAISGRLNKNADWSDYTGASPKEKIEVTAIYNVAPISGGNDTVAKVSERTGSDTKCGTTATISAISGASISSPTVNDLASNIDLTFTPSVMDSSVALNSAVAPTINGTAITIGRYNTAADYYVFNGNTLTMKPLAFTTVGATGTCTVEVKGTDGNPYTSTITVTAP